ncbi:MAG: TIGR03905 family TSCPD domain-containing protein [Bacteroidales bacterium]|nr:TIGR03905 family TSCPD domain-containing protein [Bacteroidales bacterium]
MSSQTLNPETTGPLSIQRGTGGEVSALYTCQGTCSKAISVTTKDGIIENVTFYGGCNGNTKGLAQLVKGMRAEEVINRLKGTTCGNKPTSCPDQLAEALTRLQERTK